MAKVVLSKDKQRLVAKVVLSKDKQRLVAKVVLSKDKQRLVAKVVLSKDKQRLVAKVMPCGGRERQTTWSKLSVPFLPTGDSLVGIHHRALSFTPQCQPRDHLGRAKLYVETCNLCEVHKSHAIVSSSVASHHHAAGGLKVLQLDRKSFLLASPSARPSVRQLVHQCVHLSVRPSERREFGTPCVVCSGTGVAGDRSGEWRLNKAINYAQITVDTAGLNGTPV